MPETTDNPLTTLYKILVCAQSWDENARIIGNVKAGDIVTAVNYTLDKQQTYAPQMGNRKEKKMNTKNSTTKTFYLTRDMYNNTHHVFLWNEKPYCDSRGNYFIPNQPDEDQMQLMLGDTLLTEWEQYFNVQFKKGTQIKITLEITEAVDKAKIALLESSKTTKADLIAILKDIIDGESENSRDDSDDYCICPVCNNTKTVVT